MVEELDFLSCRIGLIGTAEASEDHHLVAGEDLAWGNTHVNRAPSTETGVLARKGTRRDKHQQRDDGRDGRNQLS